MSAHKINAAIAEIITLVGFRVHCIAIQETIALTMKYAIIPLNGNPLLINSLPRMEEGLIDSASIASCIMRRVVQEGAWRS